MPSALQQAAWSTGTTPVRVTPLGRFRAPGQKAGSVQPGKAKPRGWGKGSGRNAPARPITGVVLLDWLTDCRRILGPRSNEGRGRRDRASGGTDRHLTKAVRPAREPWRQRPRQPPISMIETVLGRPIGAQPGQEHAASPPHRPAVGRQERSLGPHAGFHPARPRQGRRDPRADPPRRKPRPMPATNPRPLRHHADALPDWRIPIPFRPRTTGNHRAHPRSSCRRRRTAQDHRRRQTGRFAPIHPPNEGFERPPRRSGAGSCVCEASQIQIDSCALWTLAG